MLSVPTWPVASRAKIACSLFARVVRAGIYVSSDSFIGISGFLLVLFRIKTLFLSREMKGVYEHENDEYSLDNLARRLYHVKD